MQIRPATKFEKFFINGQCNIQFAMKIKDQNKLEPIIDKLKKNVIGLQTKTDGEYIYKHNDKIPAYDIPNNITNPRNSCLFMANHFTRPYDQALGSIGANKNTIVLNINHCCADGGYFLHIFENLKNNIEINSPKTFISVEKALENEINTSTFDPIFSTVNPKITRIFTKDKSELKNDYWMKHYVKISHANKFFCYDKFTKEMHGLNDAVWASMILASSALKGQMKQTGLSTCINLRPFINDLSYEHCNMFSVVPVTPENILPETKISDFMKNLRKVFKQNHDAGAQFGFIKKRQKVDVLPKPLDGTGLEHSSVGRFKLGGIFDDVWISLTMKATAAPGFVSYMIFSVEDGQRNDFITQMRYPPQKITDYDAKKIVESVHFCLENLNKDMTCGDALEKLIHYQKNITK